jgi:hypothetical protein
LSTTREPPNYQLRFENNKKLTFVGACFFPFEKKSQRMTTAAAWCIPRLSQWRRGNTRAHERRCKEQLAIAAGKSSEKSKCRPQIEVGQGGKKRNDSSL